MVCDLPMIVYLSGQKKPTCKYWLQLRCLTVDEIFSMPSKKY